MGLMLRSDPTSDGYPSDVRWSDQMSDKHVIMIYLPPYLSCARRQIRLISVYLAIMQVTGSNREIDEILTNCAHFEAP